MLKVVASMREDHLDILMLPDVGMTVESRLLAQFRIAPVQLVCGAHPITTGSAGENLSLTGVRWADVRPGVRMRIGTVLAEMTAWAIPCRHNARWFSDGDFNHMSHERGPVSRIYATVIEPGGIATGDRVELTT